MHSIKTKITAMTVCVIVIARKPYRFSTLEKWTKDEWELAHRTMMKKWMESIKEVN